MTRPRDIVAANLRALMAAHPALNTLPKITARCGVSNGTLDRTRRAASAINVDDLGRLAEAFGLSAWQLLVPDLRPQSPPNQGALADAVQTVIDQLLVVAEEVRQYRKD